MKRYLIPFLLLVISISGISQTSAQERQKIPKDFFMSKWGGTITGEVGKMNAELDFPFNLELIGHPGKNTAWLKLEAIVMVSEYSDRTRNITIIDSNAICAIYSEITPPVFTINFSQDVSFFNTMGVYQLAFVTGFKVEIKNDNLLSLNDRKEALAWKNGGNAKGELHRIYTKKDTLGKTVQVNEPIKTDKFTQRDIVVPNVGEVIVNTNSECKFEANKLLEQTMGEVFHILEKLKPGDFKVRMPQAVVAVRGTQFVTKAEKDGTTILTVIDGEVEFSDIQKRKTVLVKKNQKSVVKPGGLPSEPVFIDPNQILRWWE